MAPEKGYWRDSNTSDLFFACPFSDACLGGELEDGKIYPTG